MAARRETGLNEDEIAFYEALAENQSACEVMGDVQLRVIAHELMTSIRSNVTDDWCRYSLISRIDLFIPKASVDTQNRPYVIT